MRNIEYTILHTNRENNKGADFMDNLGYREQKKLQLDCFEDLPNEIKGIIKLDMFSNITTWE
ncbi:hypothetical protein LguiB_025904 [Lonicera macranthoides]